MDMLIARITQATGLDPALAKTAVGLILQFLVKEGPEAEVTRLLDAMPGAQQAVAEAGDGKAGSMGGGIMGLGGTLMASGISMGQMQALGRELFAYDRASAGEDVMGAIVGGVPGLSQFV